MAIDLEPTEAALAPPPAAANWRQRALFAVKLAVTLTAFAVVISLIDPGAVLDLMRGQNLLLVWLALGTVFAQVALGALRWRSVLIASVPSAAGRISRAIALRLYYVSVFFNAVLPGGTIGGDIVRALSTRALGVATASAVHSVVLDRMLTLTALLLMAIPAAPLLWGAAGLSTTFLLFAATVPVLATVAYAAAELFAPLRRIRARAVALLAGFTGSLRQMLSHPFEIMAAFTFAIGAHACYCVAAWLIARSIGVDLSLANALTLMPLVLIVSTLPISIGGWGVREIGAIGLLGLVGVSSHEAILVSLQFGLVSTLVALPGGLAWLCRFPRTAREAKVS